STETRSCSALRASSAKLRKRAFRAFSESRRSPTCFSFARNYIGVSTLKYMGFPGFRDGKREAREASGQGGGHDLGEAGGLTLLGSETGDPDPGSRWVPKGMRMIPQRHFALDWIGRRDNVRAVSNRGEAVANPELRSVNLPR